MSELQLGLLGIGILVVVGVLAYNKLQERRLRREAERTDRQTPARRKLQRRQARR